MFSCRCILWENTITLISHFSRRLLTPQLNCDETRALVTGDHFCHPPSLLCFDDGTSSHWSSVAFVCHRRGPSLSKRAPLYSRRAARPAEGLDVQLATAIMPSLMRQYKNYTVQINILFVNHHMRYYSVTNSLRIEESLRTNCQTMIIFNPLMWCDFL